MHYRRNVLKDLPRGRTSDKPLIFSKDLVARGTLGRNGIVETLFRRLTHKLGQAQRPELPIEFLELERDGGSLSFHIVDCRCRLSTVRCRSTPPVLLAPCTTPSKNGVEPFVIAAFTGARSSPERTTGARSAPKRESPSTSPGDLSTTAPLLDAHFCRRVRATESVETDGDG